jgi:hypothetical protein
METFVTNIGQERDQREQRTERKLALKKDGLSTSGEMGESGKNCGIRSLTKHPGFDTTVPGIVFVPWCQPVD